MNAKRDELARALRQIPGVVRAPQAPGVRAWESLAQTGIDALDELLGGGLPRGRMVELVGRRSSGRTSLALALLGASTARGEVVALVDTDGMIDARSACAAGIDLPKMLWVCASGDGMRAVRAADLILGAGGFGVVVLDVGERVPRAPDSAWLRLGRSAERAKAALVVVAPRRVAGTFASITVEASRGRPLLLGSSKVRFLDGIESQVAVVRSKRGAPGAPISTTWHKR